MSDLLHARLGAYLAVHGPAPVTRRIGPLTILPGGYASSLYTFTSRRAEPDDGPARTLVLKLYGPTARGRVHAEREWRALTGLRIVGFPVPGAVLLETDARHLGAPFIVMDHVPGTALWDAVEAADPVTRTTLTRAFVANLVSLHALDPSLLEPAGGRTPPHAHLEQELERIRHDNWASPHALDQVVQWLHQRQGDVSCDEAVILHRDYHPWNVLIDEARRTWVLDWDWQLGDARFDLAWTSTLMERSGFGAFSRTVRDEYGRQSGRSLDDMPYFEVLATVRWLLNVLPATRAAGPSETAAQAAFRLFLVEPVQQAQVLLQRLTGIDVDL